MVLVGSLVTLIALYLYESTGSNGELKSSGTNDSTETSPPDVKTKRIFVTGKLIIFFS